jgi:hypothetical protein
MGMLHILVSFRGRNLSISWLSDKQPIGFEPIMRLLMPDSRFGLPRPLDRGTTAALFDNEKNVMNEL